MARAFGQSPRAMWEESWAWLLYHDMLLSDAEEMAELQDGFREIGRGYIENHAVNDGKLLKDDHEQHRARVRRSMFWVAPDPVARQRRVEEQRAHSAAILAKAGIIVPSQEG